MRLKKSEARFIKQKAKEFFGNGVAVYLFGSRTNDNKKGGDIDLYVETKLKEKIYERKISFLLALEKMLGIQKIDIVINNFSTQLPIYKIAKKEGILL